ncbi:MAG TPA: hypothetical protein VF457_06525 [Burkholderiaceae bacterium]
MLALPAIAACSAMSVNPTAEGLKAGAYVAARLIAVGPSHARETVRHGRVVAGTVCIEYNPRAPLADLVPALQHEFAIRGVRTRVIDGPPPASSCDQFLTYDADVDWAIDPFSGGYEPYVLRAGLALRDTGGKVVASTGYRLGDSFRVGQWASTASKVAPMVDQLMPSIEPAPACGAKAAPAGACP